MSLNLSDDASFDHSSIPEAPPISQKARTRQLRKQQKEEKQHRRNPKPVQPRGRNQARYIKSLRNNSLTFGIGPAGAGKTYVAARVYGEMLMAGIIGTIYCARPNISKPQHRNGFLPGGEREKCAPWMVPIFEGLKEAMSPQKFSDAQRNGMIVEVPYEYMQGRTFKDCAVIIDEAENCDLDDLYITLTRQGEECTMALCGDPRQARINNSGLTRVVSMSQYSYMRGIGVIEFTHEDVVRSAQAKQWVKAFHAVDTGFSDDDAAIENFRREVPRFLERN